MRIIGNPGISNKRGFRRPPGDLSSSEPLDPLALVDISPWEPLEETKWRRFNWDTSCATTVFPREEFPELDSAKDQVPCRTASGEVVMASSRIAVKGSDEQGKPPPNQGQTSSSSQDASFGRRSSRAGL